jgi:hypothetical protein
MMGSTLGVFKAFIEAAWANPPASVIEANTAYLSDDFQSLDKDGHVQMNKEGYLGMTQMLMSSFKGFKSVYGDLREEGDSVIVDYHFEGTHTRDLDLSAMGLGVIPASGKKIIWPDSTVVFKIADGKIASIKPYGDSGGFESFLAPLGVKLPTA